MSAERISRLHEQASEHYLHGDFAAALASWRELLALDPHHEEALEGMRMAEQFAPVPIAPGSLEIEQDLDAGLRVFDSLGSRSPVTQEFDGGDTAQLDAPPIHAPVEEGWDPVPLEEDAGYGLAPASSAGAVPPSPTVAAVELRRRVADLLAQARFKVEAGDRDEALAILARVSILDEENADAVAMRTQLESTGKSELDRIEEAIIEGVAALEADRLDEAERLFEQALSLSPGHKEAQHYLEQAASRRSNASAPALALASTEELIGAGDDIGDLPGEPSLAVEAPLANAGKPRPSRAVAPPDDPEPATRRGFRLPSLKVLAIAGGSAIVLVCGLMAAPLLFDGGKAPTPAPAPPRPAKAKGGAAAGPVLEAAKPALSDAERTVAVARSVERGRRLAASGDFAGAVVSFNEAATLDPGNLDARAGLAGAAEGYRAQKADQDAMVAVAGAFEDGEYVSALRLAYRLPATVDAARIERIKIAGWYNLAIVALRGGDCRGAIGNLDEILSLRADDREAAKLKEFAGRYAEAAKDRAYLDTVEALPFRPFPPS